ncbi:MAG: hypothetical protein ACI4MI_04750 [Christensenellales bacterium]
MLSGDIWYDKVRSVLTDERCCGIIFFLDINCLIGEQTTSTDAKDIIGRSAVEKEIEIFEEIKKTKPDMRSFCVLNEKDESVYSIIRQAFVKCADLSDTRLKEVLPEDRVLRLIQSFNSNKLYVIKKGNYINQIVDEIAKTNPLAVTNSATAIQKFENTFSNSRKVGQNIEVIFGEYYQGACNHIVGCIENAVQVFNDNRVYTEKNKQYLFEPINWILLETDAVTATLISKNVLDFKNGYDDTIKRWIERFTQISFTNEEKEAIEKVELPSVEIIKNYAKSIGKLSFTQYVADAFAGRPRFVWLDDSGDGCREIISSIDEEPIGFISEYPDARNGLMPMIKINLEKVRRLQNG